MSMNCCPSHVRLLRPRELRVDCAQWGGDAQGLALVLRRAAPHLRRLIEDTVLAGERAVVVPGVVHEPRRERAGGEVVHHPRHFLRLAQLRAEGPHVGVHLRPALSDVVAVADEHLDASEEALVVHGVVEAERLRKGRSRAALELDHPLVLVLAVVLEADGLGVPFE
eukprot:UN3830